MPKHGGEGASPPNHGRTTRPASPSRSDGGVSRPASPGHSGVSRPVSPHSSAAGGAELQKVFSSNMVLQAEPQPEPELRLSANRSSWASRSSRLTMDATERVTVARAHDSENSLSLWTQRLDGQLVLPLAEAMRGTGDVPRMAVYVARALAFVKNVYRPAHLNDPRSDDQLAAVWMYTAEFRLEACDACGDGGCVVLGPLDMQLQGAKVKCERVDSVYGILNTDFRESSGPDDPRIARWRPYLKLLLTALSSEPLYIGNVLRGVQLSLDAIDPQLRVKGFSFRWWQFSSCTMEGDVLDDPFLQLSGDRVQFSIDCRSGVQIPHLSAEQGEAEVLLSPGALLRVKRDETSNPPQLDFQGCFSEIACISRGIKPSAWPDDRQSGGDRIRPDTGSLHWVVPQRRRDNPAVAADPGSKS